MKKKYEFYIVLTIAATVFVYCISRMLIEGVYYW